MGTSCQPVKGRLLWCTYHSYQFQTVHHCSQIIVSTRCLRYACYVREGCCVIMQGQLDF